MTIAEAGDWLIAQFLFRHRPPKPFTLCLACLYAQTDALGKLLYDIAACRPESLAGQVTWGGSSTDPTTMAVRVMWSPSPRWSDKGTSVHETQ